MNLSAILVNFGALAVSVSGWVDGSSFSAFLAGVNVSAIAALVWMRFSL